jgi:hypothetical protein
MKNILDYLSLWNSLRALALTILIYLVTVQVNEALSYPAQATHFKERRALISWSPSSGPVSHYLMEITDTQFFPGSGQKNALTRIRTATTPVPFYHLVCEHNHSYQIRVKAISPWGKSSPYSEASILFICDRKKPEINLFTPPSSTNIQSPYLALSGSYEDSNLDSITVNGITATVNAVEKSFKASLELAEGQNYIAVKAWDLAGNITTKNLDIAYTPLSGTRDNLAPFEIDYNHDGKQDILVGTAEGRIALFINTGTESDPVFSHYDFLTAYGEIIDVGTHASPFIADLNNDGKDDLLVGNGEGVLLYFENRGSLNHPVFRQPTFLRDLQGSPLGVTSFCSPCIVDWDDDSRKDILLGSGNGDLVLYHNEGQGNEPLFSPQKKVKVDDAAINVESLAVPRVSDWDGDGGKDLLLRNEKGQLFLFLNEVLHGEPDLFPAEAFQVDNLKVISSEFPASIPFSWH